MAPYSMDLRTRVLRGGDAGMKAEVIAEKYHVSRAWVHRVQQRRLENLRDRSTKTASRTRERVQSSPGKLTEH